MKRELGALMILIVAGYIITSGLGGGLQNFSYSVDNWDEDGFYTQDITATEDRIFIDSNSDGTWTSDLIVQRNHFVESVFVDGDSTYGEITLHINMWNGTNADGQPDRTITREVLTGENSFEFENNDTYDSFEFEILLNKTSENQQERPSVDILEAELGSNEINFTNFDNLFLIMMFIVLLWGLYAILS